MKLLHVGKYFPPETGGMEVAVLELCKGLYRNSAIDELTCLVSNTQFSTVVEENHGFKVIRAGSLMKLASTPLSWKFKRELKSSDVDLLHFHLPNPLATFASSGIKLPYIVTYHCDILRYKFFYKFYEPHMKRFLADAQRIVVTSQKLIETSPILSGFKEKCVAVSLAVSPTHLALNDNGENLKKKLLKAYCGRLILFVGRLVEYKGLDTLIRAMVKVDGQLFIVGTGPQKRKLEKLTRSLDLESKIQFVGHVPQEELGAYYEACTLVALTSLDEREAFGMCLLDGLACGKPLVTTNLNTGVASVNEDGVTGFHVPVRDVPATANCINHILNDPLLARELGENAREHYDKNFRFEKMINSYVQIYKEALAV